MIQKVYSTVRKPQDDYAIVWMRSSWRRIVMERGASYARGCRYRPHERVQSSMSALLPANAGTATPLRAGGRDDPGQPRRGLGELGRRGERGAPREPGVANAAQ